MSEELYTREHFLEILEALHYDQTGLERALYEIRSIVNGWSWVTESRGSYEWDDADYQKEFGYCIENVVAKIDETLKESVRHSHQICCGKYRLMNPALNKPPVQRRFVFGRDYDRLKEEVLQAATISPDGLP